MRKVLKEGKSFQTKKMKDPWRLNLVSKYSNCGKKPYSSNRENFCTWLKFMYKKNVDI